MFAELYIAGILDDVAGIIVDHFTACTAKHFDSKGISAEDVVDFWCNRIKVPCIKHFPYGHVENRYVLPIGHLVTLDASKCRVGVDFGKRGSLL